MLRDAASTMNFLSITKIYTYKDTLMTTTKPDDIDGYIAGFPDNVQKMLEQIRATIKEAAPDAEEVIKYAMPTFMLNGNLVHFAAFKNYIGFYPAPTGVEAFQAALSVYKQGKGSIQFPLDQPMPLSLITKIVKFRVKQLAEKTAKKK